MRVLLTGHLGYIGMVLASILVKAGYNVALNMYSAGAEQLYRMYRSSALSLQGVEGSRNQRIGHINKLLADRILNTELRHIYLLSAREGACASALLGARDRGRA
jgi:nucleoside-diphosphate-sugar epimerase